MKKTVYNQPSKKLSSQAVGDETEQNVENEEEFEGSETYLEEETVEDENEEENEEEIEAEEEETPTVKKKRCQRKKKIIQICFDEIDDEGERESEEDLYKVEEEEEEEGEEEEGFDVYSSGSSILSAITFEWENEIYEFEELCDPGTIENIYKRYYFEPSIYDDVGKIRYLHMCRILCATPILRFYQALTTNEVDLSFREVDSKNIRAICAALETNIFVEKLILKFNTLVKDDCYYLGLMLHTNEYISFLDLTGCRIGPEGLELLIAHLARNEVLLVLNLSKCNIQDEGMKLLSSILIHNNSIQKLDLSFNNLGEESALALGLVLKVNKCLTNLNLGYNNMFDPTAMKAFFRGMMVNDSITHLNLAWNAMSGEDVGTFIGNFLRRNATINFLDLSDNRLEGLAIIQMKKGLGRSRSLETLKMGKNPMSPEDLEILLAGVKNCSTLKILDLEDLWVKKTFVKNLKKIQLEREIEVNFAGIFGNYEVFGPDYPKVILERAQFEAQKPKKKKQKRDFGHLIWTLGEDPLTEEEFMTRVRKFKAKINKELYPELIKQFIIPKQQLIDVVAMRKKYLSLFPESMPPPPPKIKKKGKITDALEEQIEPTTTTYQQEEHVTIPLSLAESEKEEEEEDEMEIGELDLSEVETEEFNINSEEKLQAFITNLDEDILEDEIEKNQEGEEEQEETPN